MGSYEYRFTYGFLCDLYIRVSVFVFVWEIYKQTEIF